MSDTTSLTHPLVLCDPASRRWLEFRRLGEVWMVRADQAVGGRSAAAYLKVGLDPVFDALLDSSGGLAASPHKERWLGEFDSSPRTYRARLLLAAVADRTAAADVPCWSIARRATDLLAVLDSPGGRLTAASRPPQKGPPP